MKTHSRIVRLVQLWRRLDDVHDDIELVLEGLLDIADATPNPFDDRIILRIASVFSAHPEADAEAGTMSAGLAKVSEGLECLAKRVPGAAPASELAGALRGALDHWADEQTGEAAP